MEIILTPLIIFLLLAAAFVFSVVSWRWPDIAAAAVIFFAPLYLIKFTVWRVPLTVLELLLLSFILACLANKIFKRVGVKKQKAAWLNFTEKKNFWLSVAVMLLGAFLATAFSENLRVSAGILKSWILEPLIFAVLAVEALDGQRTAKWLLGGALVSGAAVAAVSLGYLICGRLTFDGRLAAFYLSPNHLAMFLAPALLLAAGFLFDAKKRWQKSFLLVVACLLLVILYFTYSYGAWLAVFLAGIFAIFLTWRLKAISGKKLAAIGGLLLVALALLAFLQLGGEKLANLLRFERSSLQSRLIIWQAAGRILSGNWLLGIGPGMFQKYYLDYQRYFPPYLEWAVPQPQNLFLAWWLQAGILGLAGFVWLLVGFFQKTWAAVKKQKTSKSKALEGAAPIIILMAVVFYLLAHGLIDATYWKNDLALVFWVVIALGYRADRLAG
jgi:O-antigen ligase